MAPQYDLYCQGSEWMPTYCLEIQFELVGIHVYTSIHAENGIWNAGGQACAGAADFIKISGKMFSSPLKKYSVIPASYTPRPSNVI